MVLGGFKILGINSKYAEKVSELLLEMKNRKHSIELRDVIIAILSIQNRLILTTFNEKKYLNYTTIKLLKINK